MKKILIINNDFDTMLLLEKWLEKKGYDVKFSGNNREVMSIIHDFKPGLIIIDILQNQIIDEIKADKQAKYLPILMMTGYTLRRKGRQFAVDDSIEKPFDLGLLEKKINGLINTGETV
jgi:DNA-binding response OmpR family regulator